MNRKCLGDWCEILVSNRLLLFLTQLLRDSSHLVRCKCLELIGALGSPDHSVAADVGQSQSSTSALSVLGDFSRDPDGRVRTQSFQSMVCISAVTPFNIDSEKTRWWKTIP